VKAAYVVIVYDESGDRAAAFNEAASPSYSRAKNAADQVSIQVPYKDDNIQEIVIGRRFEIVRGVGGSESIETSGYISEHGYSGEWYDISGYTEEIYLARFLTPAQYGYPFYSEQTSLAGFFNNFSRGFETIQTKREWGEATPTGFTISAESNVDYSTQPDIVLLSNTGGVYETSGSITFQFEKETSELWERIRWVSDYDEASGFTTTVEYRTGATAGTLGGWTVATAGALTDVVGLLVGDQTSNFLEVRVNLATTDTTGSATLYALEVVKRTAQILTVDSSTFANEDATLLPAPAIEADRASLLEVLIDGCEVAEWEFKLEDGTLYLSDDFGTDRTNVYALVES